MNIIKHIRDNYEEIRTIIESQLKVGEEMNYGSHNKAGLVVAEILLYFEKLENCSVVEKEYEEEVDDDNYLFSQEPCCVCGEINGMRNPCCPGYDDLHIDNCGYG